MRQIHIPNRAILPLVLSIAATFATTRESRGADPSIPPFDAIEKTALAYFEELPDYLPGDLITRTQVEPLLDQLKKMGLPLPDEAEILESVPDKNSFIVKQLSTPAGRKFMRSIARFPDAYDRVDRLSRLPRGKQTVRDLIRGP
ncbi:MAG: hypothetical protein JW959_12170, partial [Pirellulales bacterium]|nr:hypothetical protein [Pirellulales bacterium]